jgi:hypothetical protein
MNQNRSYSINRPGLLLLGAIILTFLQGEAILPSERDKKEILTINEKKRTYYQLHNNTLTYKIAGPKRIEIIARGVVPKKGYKVVRFAYKLITDNGDSIIINQTAVKIKNITSAQHPGHGFTLPGKYFINISKGNHWFKIEPIPKADSPIVIRVRVKEFEKGNKDRQFVQTISGTKPKSLIIGEKSVRYYELKHGERLQFEPKKLNKLTFLSRLAFVNGMSNYENYQIRVWKDDTIYGTYFFSTEKSEDSIIKEDKKVIPGKWRSCEVNLSKSKHTYSVELLDKGKKVFVRCLGNQ